MQNVWFLKDVPKHIRDHLNLPNSDEGIDLIAKTKEDKFWAIQCKYQDDEGTPLGQLAGDTWRELDNDFFQRLNVFLQNKPTSIEARTPRKHQLRSIERAYGHFIENRNARGKLNIVREFREVS